MEEIKILVARHFGFESNHVTNMTIESILPHLKKKYNVKIIWFFFFPEKTNATTNNLDYEIQDIHNYSDGIDAIGKIKPDIVFDNEFPALIDLALDIGAKYHKIPVVTRMISTDDYKMDKKQMLTKFLPLLFQNTMPYEEKQKTQFFRRGRFFFYKYKFLIKTLFKSNRGVLENLDYIISTIKWHISYEMPLINPKFENDLHYLENEKLREKMLEAGFSPKSLIVTGNPVYDKNFQKFKNKSNNLDKKKFNVLFAPIQHYESGIWSKKEIELTITKIIEIFKENKDGFELIVKLHPSSQRYEFYENIIHKIDREIKIIQKGTIEDYLENSDIVISFPPLISSLIFPLISSKPLILCDFIQFQPQFIPEKNVAWLCSDPTLLIHTIKKSIKEHRPDIIKKYLESIMYKTDGESGKRLAEAIIKLFESNSINNKKL